MARIAIARGQVVYGWTGYSGEPPKRKRKVKGPPPRTAVTLTHRPSGISVSAEAPRRRFSRRAMQDQLLKLRRRLLRELEEKVARRGMKPPPARRKKGAAGQ